MLHMLDTNQEKNKANDVAMEVAIELVKRVNADYGKEIVMLLFGTNPAYQAKSVLRMLTAIVTRSPAQAREVFQM